LKGLIFSIRLRQGASAFAQGSGGTKRRDAPRICRILVSSRQIETMPASQGYSQAPGNASQKEDTASELAGRRALESLNL